ncbi:MAG: TAXI family TRAP transporter solute-binding subunit [Thermoanaerobaculales bacterium]
MAHPDSTQDVGSSLPIPAIVATIVAFGLIVGGFFTFRSASSDWAHEEIVIATGPDTGTYYALGLAVARVLETEGVVKTATVLPTDGSGENMRLIGGLDGGADIAFIQSDTPPNHRVRLIAPLYEEVLHIMVAKRLADEIRTIHDLRGRRVSLGAEDSGTRQVAERVLGHFDVAVSEDLALLPREAADGLIDGSVDVAFLLTAIPSRMVEVLGHLDAARFLSLGDPQELGNAADALALVYPSLQATTIPHATYVRIPERPVSTIAVSALLVAPKSLDPRLVQSITSTLFDRRSGLSGPEGRALLVTRHIRERYRPGTAVIPYHEGAIAFYNREEPPFFVEYAEALSLGLTLLVGLYSIYVAFREWMRRRMKNRIDAYYMEVERQSVDLGELSLEELVEHRDALDNIRHRAFSDLVNERLRADESFTIFQDYLGNELTSIEARIAKSR